MIKTIIFDYDGVIVDSFPCVFEIYKIMCKEFGKKCPNTIEEFRKVYGRNSKECFSNLGFSIEDKSKVEPIFERETLKKKPNLFEGIPEVLQKLSEKYKFILVSTNYKSELMQKLESLNIMKYFPIVVGSINKTSAPINKGEVISQLLKEQNLKADEVIMIGDRDNDYEAATKANIKNIILVEYGWGYHKETLPHQKVIVNKPLDLLEAVKAIES